MLHVHFPGTSYSTRVYGPRVICSLLMYGRAADHRIGPQQTVDFCRGFYDVGFELFLELNPSVSIYATCALSGRLLFHARVRRPVLLIAHVACSD